MQENAADGAVSSLHPCSSLSVFAFRMPVLRAGDYVVAAAVAEGTQSEHEQLHWIHDALAFHSHSSSVCTGLVGVPMLSVTMEMLEGVTAT